MTANKLLKMVAFLLLATIWWGCGNDDPYYSPYGYRGNHIYGARGMYGLTNYQVPVVAMPSPRRAQSYIYTSYVDPLALSNFSNYYSYPTHYGHAYFGYGYATPAQYIQTYRTYLTGAPTYLIGRPYLVTWENLAKRFAYNLLTLPLRSCAHAVPIATGYCSRCYNNAHVMNWNLAANYLDYASYHLLRDEPEMVEKMIAKGDEQLGSIDLPSARKIAQQLPGDQGRLSAKEQAVRLIEARAAIDQARYGF